ncbi:hypothetical protein [Ktedonospora formicarum]|uniref:DUF2269 family protein n=1 Tax=Ktedonospora formicarum TaxID=2778364 RepID=A0A8J3I4F5_9CHLR|nr:hypothetical protein [Ktedonospora formicarum]GHO46808.1 hypothetical protein KSX_49710 [Ktedonospora formicarum]
MASYSYPLFLHIVGVVGLFIAISLQTASLIGIVHARTVEQVRVWCSSHKVLIRIFIISFLLTLLPGMHLTFNTWGWSTAWINASVVALLVLSGLGPLINTRRLRAIHKASLVASDGPIPDALARQSRDPLLWSSILGMNGLAIGIIYLMVLKPDLLGSIIALCISTLLGVGIAWFVWRLRPATTPLPSVN